MTVRRTIKYDLARIQEVITAVCQGLWNLTWDYAGVGAR